MPSAEKWRKVKKNNKKKAKDNQIKASMSSRNAFQKKKEKRKIQVCKNNDFKIPHFSEWHQNDTLSRQIMCKQNDPRYYLYNQYFHFYIIIK